jgi:hypothetical protein
MERCMQLLISSVFLCVECGRVILVSSRDGRSVKSVSIHTYTHTVRISASCKEINLHWEE